MKPLDFDEQLVPDSDVWSMGFGRSYTAEELTVIANELSREPHDLGNRLHASAPGYQRRMASLRVPGGYDASVIDVARCNDTNLPTSLSNNWLVNAGLEAFTAKRGWTRDQHGRPCHPHFTQLLARKAPGLLTGPGNHSFMGEHASVQVVVVDRGKVLVSATNPRTGEQVNKGWVDAGMPSVRCLPRATVAPEDLGVNSVEWQRGNRVTTQEGLREAARRAVRHWTGMRIATNVHMDIVRAARPIELQDTLNAWQARFTLRVIISPSEIEADIHPATGATYVSFAEAQQLAGPMRYEQQHGLLAAIR